MISPNQQQLQSEDQSQLPSIKPQSDSIDNSLQPQVNLDSQAMQFVHSSNPQAQHRQMASNMSRTSQNLNHAEPIATTNIESDMQKIESQNRLDVGNRNQKLATTPFSHQQKQASSVEASMTLPQSHLQGSNALQPRPASPQGDNMNYIQLRDFSNQYQMSNDKLAVDNNITSPPFPNNEVWMKQDSRMKKLNQVETKFDRVASGTSTGASIPSTLGATGNQAVTGSLNMIGNQFDKKRMMPGVIDPTKANSPYVIQQQQQQKGANPLMIASGQRLNNAFGVNSNATVGANAIHLPEMVGQSLKVNQSNQFGVGIGKSDSFQSNMNMPMPLNQNNRLMMQPGVQKGGYAQMSGQAQFSNLNSAQNAAIQSQKKALPNGQQNILQSYQVLQNQQNKQRMVPGSNSNTSTQNQQNWPSNNFSQQISTEMSSQAPTNMSEQQFQMSASNSKTNNSNQSNRIRRFGPGQQSSTVVTGNMIAQPQSSQMSATNHLIFKSQINQNINQALIGQQLKNTIQKSNTTSVKSASGQSYDNMRRVTNNVNSSINDISRTNAPQTSSQVGGDLKNVQRFMNTGQNILQDQSSTSRQLLNAAIYSDEGFKNQAATRTPLLNQTAQQAQIDYTQYAANNQQQISSTLFIMDCQTFGIFNNQKLLKLSNIRGPQTAISETHTPQYQYTEAQIVNFVMNRALTSQQQALAQQQAVQSQDPKAQQTYQQQQLMMIPKELPKLSEDSKRILTTIKAQQHLTNVLLQESQKIDTLIIELDYYDYKNQLLQQLFHHYGNRVLSNLVHKITQIDDSPTFQNFQRVEDYVEKVRKMQQDKVKQRNEQQQKLFSQINDLSSGNEEGKPMAFHSVDGNQADEENAEADDEEVADAKRKFFGEQRKSEGTLKKSGTIAENERANLISHSERKEKKGLDEEGNETNASPEAQIEDDVSESDLQNYAEEIQHLFPKYAVKERHGLREIHLDNTNETPSSPAKNGKEEENPQPGKEKKMKKLNFHVIVKNTRLYHALRFVEAYKRRQEKLRRKAKDEDGDTEKESSQVVMGAAATMSQYGNSDNQFTGSSSSIPDALSTFVLVNDCSMLKFALYCFHVGIVNSVQQMMRQFFKHVFIVIKPGKKHMPDGTIQYLRELPQIDVDKINKYLIQTKIRKSMQHSAAMNSHLKGGIEGQRRLSQMGGNQLDQNSPNGRMNRDSAQNDAEMKLLQSRRRGNFNRGQQNGRYDTKSGQQNANGQGNPQADRELVRVSSLASFKSQKDLYSSKQTFNQDYWQQFNSGQQTTIKVEGAAAKEPTTIKIIHKCYTHLDNSRIQKAFKIYNEFTQLIFKSRLQTILHLPETSAQYNKEFFTKAEFNRVYKLAGHMGVKLPRKSYSTTIGRQPLIETLKNHRQVAIIKEQMIRFCQRMLNEENNMSMNFQSCVIQATVNFSDKAANSLQSPTKSNNQANDPLAMTNTNDSLPTKLGKNKNNLIVCQQTPFYKYQVGFGNNHYLIKALMKQRPWLHQLQRDKNSMMNGIIKLDFEESQILWTQWRRPRLYDHTQTKKAFDEEFKQVLQAIGPSKRLYAIMNNQNGIMINYEQKQAKQNQEKAEVRQTSGLDDQSNLTKAQRKQSLKAQRTGTTEQKAQPNKPSAEVRQSKSIKGGGSKMGFDNQKEQKSMSKKKEDCLEDDLEASNSKLEVEPEKDSINLNMNEMKYALERCKRKIQRIYNRLEFNQHLNNKKALFLNMRNYYNYCCGTGQNNQGQLENGEEGGLGSGFSPAEEGFGQNVFDTLPLTFHIKSGAGDAEYMRFEDYYRREQMKCQQQKHRKNIWIIKPGENSNRGVGIKVESELGKIKGLVHSYTAGDRTMILQKYIDNPLLYQRRKFDIRCFSLVTCINGVIKGYFYREGYIRTASKEYTLGNLQNKFIHLVNDAVQKYSEDYGKFEPGNKLSYNNFQKFLGQQYPDKKINFERDIILQVKKIVTDTIRATFHLLDSKKRLNSYELFGYDFMFDDNFKPFLIEVNSNPSLEPSCNLLTKMFTQMLDNTFRIAIDPLFPPQEGYSLKKGSIGVDIVPENKFDLIFDERVDGAELLKKFSQIGQQELAEIESINQLEGSECGDDEDENLQEEDKEQEAKANEAVHGVMQANSDEINDDQMQ